jgi:hypothetical protein
MAVTGGTTITFGDRLRARWTPANKLTLVLLALVVVATTFDNLRELPREPFGPAIVIFTEFVAILLTWAFWVGLVVAMVAIANFRTSADQRRISYELNDAGVVTRDGMGASLSCPWTNVRRARETSRAFRLSLKPMGSRYIPARAFAPTDLPVLRTLLREKLGNSAKLRGK